MKTFKQKNFKRNHECTNVKFIQTLDGSILDANFWVECDESEIDCNQLWKEGQYIKYGYL